MYGTIRQLSLQKDLQSVLKRTYKCVCVCVCVCVLLGSLHTVMHDHSEKRQHQETYANISGARLDI